jgi:hypothetical protein
MKPKTPAPSVDKTGPGAPYESALAHFQQAKTALDAANQARRQHARKVASMKSEIAAAVRKEDFNRAAELKQARDALEESVSVEAMRALEEAVTEATVVMAERYFGQPEQMAKTSVQVTRVHVMNPLSNNSVEVVFLDADLTLSFALDGNSFDGEAYRLAAWTRKHGFLARQYTANVDV